MEPPQRAATALVSAWVQQASRPSELRAALVVR